MIVAEYECVCGREHEDNAVSENFLLDRFRCKCGDYMLRKSTRDSEDYLHVASFGEPSHRTVKEYLEKGGC